MAYENTIGFDPSQKWRDDGQLNRPPFALGTRLRGRDGHDYVFAKASAAVPASTVVILTETAGATYMTVATGAGAWTSPAFALALNDYAWMRKTVI
jgi:hypothetical protein